MREATEATNLYRSIFKSGVRASWFPIAVFLFHAVLSKGFNAYEAVAETDIPMHILGGVAITYFFAGTFKPVEDALACKPAHVPIYLLFLFSLTGTATVIWEFAEFISDYYFDTGAQKGIPDTMLDMALGLFGAVLFLAPYLWLKLRRLGA